MFQFQSRLRLAALLLATPLVFAACSKDKNDPVPDEDNEQITTVAYTLTPTGGGTPILVTWRDTDGTGGTAPVITPLNLSLRANTTYTGTLSLMDETKDPDADITEEVKEEGDEHLLVYTPTPAQLLTVTSTDKDSKNLPVGITTTLVANAVGTGSLRITLRHQPGTKDGTSTPGDTDVEVNFPVTIVQ